MLQIDFCKDWKFRKKGEEEFTVVTLPHDAMIYEERFAECESGSAGAYFPGGVYEYEKEFEGPSRKREGAAAVPRRRRRMNGCRRAAPAGRPSGWRQFGRKEQAAILILPSEAGVSLPQFGEIRFRTRKPGQKISRHAPQRWFWRDRYRGGRIRHQAARKA